LADQELLFAELGIDQEVVDAGKSGHHNILAVRGQ
jgi:hypothetical protein